MTGHISDQVNADQLKAYTEQEVRRLAAEYEFSDENFNLSHYIPPGPVARAFIASKARTSIIMGPLGGGKTTACVFKRIYAATLAPIAIHPTDKVPTRMCKWIVLRNTMREVEQSVLGSWKQWFPKNYPGGIWDGGGDRPARHVLRFMGVDGFRIEAITEFQGLNDQAIGEKMKGTEYSGAWLNELDTHAEGALDDVEQRVGRYPARTTLVSPSDERGKMVIADMNAPTIDNWTYGVCITNRKPNREFFAQASGMSAEAENLPSLEDDYYQMIVDNQDERFVQRMVHNQFGYSMAGKAVHPTFDHRRHVARVSIPTDPNLELGIGVDISTNALTPAAVFGQNSGRRIRVLDELYPGQGFGPVRFAEALQQRLNERFGNARNIRLWADPASSFGGDKEGGQLAALDVLQQTLSLPVQLPFDGSNELSLRLEAVNLELRGNLDPDSWLQIDPSCTFLIEALAGRYRFKKLSAHASNEHDDKPEKSHPWSDICDALQYLVGGMRGRTAIIRNAAGKKPDDGQSGGWGKARANGGFDPRTIGL